MRERGAKGRRFTRRKFTSRSENPKHGKCEDDSNCNIRFSWQERLNMTSSFHFISLLQSSYTGSRLEESTLATEFWLESRLEATP